MPKDVLYGKTLRKSFARMEEIQDMPNLLEIQKKSYKWFVEEGLRDVLKDMSAIKDHSGKVELSFVDYTVGFPGKDDASDEDSRDRRPRYTIAECKERDATYAAPLRVKVRLKYENGEMTDYTVFMGDLPIMTDGGTFIINGAERVIVSQIVRSPGVYFDKFYDRSMINAYASTVIPYHGAWLEYETDANNVFYVRIDKSGKLPITTFLKAIGIYDPERPETWLSCVDDPIVGACTNERLKEIFGDDERITATLDWEANHQRDKKGASVQSAPVKSYGRDECLIEIHLKLRPGDPATVESADTLLKNLFFDHRRYDISNVGRYMFNKKLAIGRRIVGRKLAETVVDRRTGEILAEEGTVVSRELAQKIEDAGVVSTWVEIGGNTIRVFSNGMVKLENFVDFDPAELGISEKVRGIVLERLMQQYEGEELKQAILDNIDVLIPKHIVVDDIFASVNYLNCLANGIGTRDDIDHLGNRRVRCVGELLQNQFRIGFSRMERIIRERMSLQEPDIMNPNTLVNIRPVTAAIKEFFGSSPLSQFMDQTNPLSELTNKRRVSALGPGGLSRDRASFDVRDVHYSHYGRLCPIETPEGGNIGLISYLASYARVNEHGFIVAPFQKVEKGSCRVTEQVEYLTADMEDNYVVAPATEPRDENGCLINQRITCRHRDEIVEVDRSEVDYIDISPKMMVSIATAMIPFLENDDANRALMGANMQRQAVPLIKTEAPIVATGIEHKCAVDSGVVVLAEGDGTVSFVDAKTVTINYDCGEIKKYDLIKFSRSNQGTCVNQRPIVTIGERVKAGDVIADGPSTSNGELSLGRNILVGFMTWEGYNYEDAILLNERLVIDDVFTSIHIEEYECDARDTKLGPEEITRDIPGVGDDALKYLDENGIITIGAEVRAGDILVGKVTPKGETDLTAEERLLRAIFGEKAREVRDTSLKVPHGESGIIVDVKHFTRDKAGEKRGDVGVSEMGPGVNEVVRVYIAQKRKISVGDKMAGRHGNKGVVSRILPREDMPFLPNGTPLDIVLNPLGVPSRMNIGQVLEVHLGYAAQALGWKVATPIFNGANEETIRNTLRQAGLRDDGKDELYDGRTGEKFDNDVTVGWVYFLKLHHLVDDKIHARSTGPYSLVTQQPLGGKAQFGGQRFGEMEVWALEAYGAAYTLQEILTVKSDDVTGRVRTYESIVKGNNIPAPGVPESFKVLVKELQALCLNVEVLDADGDIIELRDDEDDDMKVGRVDFPESDSTGMGEDEFASAGGFSFRDRDDLNGDLEYSESYSNSDNDSEEDEY